jgi:hypothetical protein
LIGQTIQHRQESLCPKHRSVSRDDHLDWVAVGVEDFGVAEEGGLLDDLVAVADDNDLGVRGIEMAARG